jgi:hypothetical protein
VLPSRIDVAVIGGGIIVGREHGRAMIEQYTELKSICIASPKE